MDIAKNKFTINLPQLGIAAIYCIAGSIIFFQPLEPRPWQKVDDALYMNNAIAILHYLGSLPWLGPFNQTSLSKAPFFSIFLATIHYFGIPYRFAEFSFFAPLPFLFVRAMRPFSFSKKYILLLASFCLILIPAAGTESRVLRETLFGGITIYFMILFCGFIVRYCLNRKNSCRWAIGAGVAFGIAVSTRAEGLWLLLPTLTGFTLSIMLFAKRSHIVKLVVTILLFFAGYMAPVSAISTLNYYSYGIFSPSLRQTREFKNLYSTLCSLVPNKRQRYIPINTFTRYQVYKISPHFAKLKPFLEGDATNQLATSKIHFLFNGYPNKREFFVSTFEFALEDSIFLAGYNSGPKFIDFCKKAVDEINDAVSKNKIKAGQKGFSLLPPLLLSDAPQITSSAFRSFWLLIRNKGIKRAPVRSRFGATKMHMEMHNWHIFLKTWPYPLKSSYVPEKFGDFGYKKLVSILTVLYPLVLLLGIASFFISLTKKYFIKDKLIFIILSIAWASLIGFNLSMGIVDTIAFPILQWSTNFGHKMRWATSYNRMGYYPLHYLLLISAIYSSEIWEKVNQFKQAVRGGAMRQNSQSPVSRRS